MQAIRSSDRYTTTTTTDEGNRRRGGRDDDEQTRQAALKRRRPLTKRSVSSVPTTVEIRGVPIHFPFQPYACQITYMTCVIQALQQSENALLESPTGTGKTLCLLCACLAYQQQNPKQQKQLAVDTDSVSTVASLSNNNNNNRVSNNNPSTTTTTATTTIIYASRTHSQLSQVVRELRNTRYRPNHAVLGSREQLCIHPKVNPNAAATTTATTNSSSKSRPNKPATPTTAYDINQNCNRLGKERKCRFRNNLDGFQAPSNDPSCIQTNSHQRMKSNNNNNNNKPQQSVRDMEELIQMGKDHAVCPFYYTRSLVDPNVEILFVPYNYLFDREARETTLAQIHWENAILVFDEAHNLEAFASDSASFDLSHIHIAGCIAEVSKTIQFIQAMSDGAGSSGMSSSSNIKLESLITLKGLFLKLEMYIMNLGPQTAYRGEYMMDVLKDGCSITFSNHEIFIQELRKVNDFLTDIRGGGGGSTSSSSSGPSGAPKLEHFIQCVKRVYGYGTEARCMAKASFYRVHVSPKTTAVTPAMGPPGRYGGRGGGNGGNGPVTTTGRTVSYWCFAPSLAMEELSSLNVRSILVTSGTLSPLPSYSMELGLSFPHMIENPHIITSNQIHVRVIGNGVSGKLLNSSYERRQNNEYYIELGNTLVTLAKVVPQGMLVFFPSYSVMESCIEAWGGPASSRSNYNNNNNSSYKGKDFFAAKKLKPSGGNQTSFSFPLVSTHVVANDTGIQQNSPWKRLLGTKSIVTEPKSSTDLPEALADFKRYLGMPKSPGCILMGVCRGKISEGIDFADEQSRAVVITGLPFPPSHDTKVKMKREYLDNIRIQGAKKASGDGGFAVNKSKGNLNDKLSGNEWYTQQAHRAVNQAIGRVIRNRNDYGAVLLLDSRFDQPQNQQGLSKWLRPHIQKDEGFGIAIRSLAAFYKVATSYTEQKKLEEKRAVDAAKPILEYEDDFGDGDDELPNKIAVLRRPASIENDGAHTSDSKSVAYVDPSDVVARFDVNEVLQPRVQNAYDDTILKAPPILKSRDDIFDTKLPPPSVPASTETKSKNLAEEFMVKMRQQLSTSDQSKVRRGIIAMKGAGEKNDQKLFIEAVKPVLWLLVVAEKLGANRLLLESSMLYMFFSLLPVANRNHVEVISLELVFQNSSLFKLLHPTFDETKLNSIRSSMGVLLQKLWLRKTGQSSLQSVIYLREANSILVCISSNLSLQSYLNLIPEHYHIMTQTWMNEMIASRNIERMKQKDRQNVGDASVDATRFQNRDFNHAEHTTDMQPGQPNHASRTSTSTTTISKGKVHEPFVAPRPKIPSNPYAKQATHLPMKKTAVMKMVELAESEVYIKPDTSNVVKNIKTNAPKNLICAICSETCREPFIAECGHMACLSCWLGWLNRSKTCMTCRVETKKESLARVVYERKAGGVGGSSANPTLTQLCQEDDSDYELEIRGSS